MSNITWLDFNDADDVVHYDIEKLHGELIRLLPHVLAYLFPKGKVKGKQFIIGDVDGNPGKSMVVELEGPNSGMWFDFATSEGGNIVELWACVKKIDPKINFIALAEDITSWLCSDTKKYKPAKNTPLYEDLGPYSAKWDYHDQSGNLIACVYRYETADGKEFRPWDVKARSTKAPSPRPLYNQPQIKDADVVVLVEGEKAADALISSGIVATTAMNGANAPVDKTDWTPLYGKQVIIWPDNDEAGKNYANKAAHAIADASAVKVSVLEIPDDKPAKWDADDAVNDSLDARAFIAECKKKVVANNVYGIVLSDWKASDRFKGNPPQRRWLIEGIFPMAQASLVASSGGVGKSFLLLHLAREVADYNGFALNAPSALGGVLSSSGAAVYLTAEDDAIEVHNRLRSLGEIPDSLYVIPLPDVGGAMHLFSYSPDARVPVVTGVWNSLTSQLKAMRDLSLVVIDPLQPLCALDLNIPENAQFVCSNLSSLAAKTGASVIISHHFAKREAANPEQAREAIRGSGGLVDGVRAVYALWHPKEENSRAICKSLQIPFERARVIMGGIVKANGKANLQITTYIRDITGLLVDRTGDIIELKGSDRSLMQKLKKAIGDAAFEGRPYTKTGDSGVHTRRHEFPKELQNIGKHKFLSWVEQLLADGEIVAAMARGSRVVKWLDIPTGPIARGESNFKPGHIKCLDINHMKSD